MIPTFSASIVIKQRGTQVPPWVIRDFASQPRLPFNVRFPAKATDALLCSEMTRRANRKHFHSVRARGVDVLWG